MGKVKDSQINPGIEREDFGYENDANCVIGMNGNPQKGVEFYYDEIKMEEPRDIPMEGTGPPVPKETKDPWVHRSEGMKCNTCMYYVKKKTSSEVSVEIGRCRRNAPTMKGYPAVFPSDWCGEHKLDEEKLLCG